MESLRVKQILKKKGIKGKDLANQVGISPSAMSSILNNKVWPKYDTLKRIADALGVCITSLLVPTKPDCHENVMDKISEYSENIGKLADQIQAEIDRSNYTTSVN